MGFAWKCISPYFNSREFPWANSEISHRLHTQVMEAESSVRAEWAKLSQNRPGVNLSNMMEIVAHRHAICLLASEFTKPKVKG